MPCVPCKHLRFAQFRHVSLLRSTRTRALCVGYQDPLLLRSLQQCTLPSFSACDSRTHSTVRPRRRVGRTQRLQPKRGLSREARRRNATRSGEVTEHIASQCRRLTPEPPEPAFPALCTSSCADAVGSLVGALVGDGVPLPLVGGSAELRVGLSVGPGVGLPVGPGVGLPAGPGDGGSAGLGDGGSAELRVGLSVGPGVGLSVGPGVGLSVGPGVGLPVGLGVGGSVGLSVGGTTPSTCPTTT
eukprot:scaffold455_cov160-Pinguiococcus_pyrenoidosus.AAC.6